MTVLTLCWGESITREASIANEVSTIADDFDDTIRPEITPPMIANVRRGKIVRVRQQLACGTYDLDERMDAVLERILADINT